MTLKLMWFCLKISFKNPNCGGIHMGNLFDKVRDDDMGSN